MDQSARVRYKTRIFLIIVILSNPFGDLLLKHGLSLWGGDLGVSPAGYIRAIFNPWVAGGILLLILWFLSRMALLSWADLSYVLPMTAMGYVVAALLGRFFFNENISASRWFGTALIVAGIALVGRTSAQTTGGDAT